MQKQITNQIYEKYKSFVRKIATISARKYPKNIRWDIDDLENAGWVGFIESWNAYDPSFNVPFKTYAYRQILNRILKFIDENMFTLRVLYQNIKNDPDKLTLVNNQETGAVREYNVRQTEESFGLDFVPARSELLDDIVKKESRNAVRKEVAKFSKIDQKVIKLYYIDGKTLQEVGAACNRSHEWARLRLKKISGLLKDRFVGRGWSN